MPLLDFLFRPKKEEDLFEEFEKQIREQEEPKPFLEEEHQPLPDMFGGRELEEPVVRLDAMMERGLEEELVPIPKWFEEVPVELPDWFEGRELYEPKEAVELPDWFGRELMDENYFGLKTLFEGEPEEPIEVPEWFGEREVVKPHLQQVLEIPQFIREEPEPPPMPDVFPEPQPDRIDKLIQPWLDALEKALLKHKTHQIVHLFPGREPEETIAIPEFIGEYHHRLEEIDAMPERTVEEISAKIQALKEFEKELSKT